MTIVNNSLLDRVATMQARALKSGAFAIIHRGQRYVMEPAAFGGQMVWSVTMPDGWTHHFTGNSRKVARENLISWLEN